MNVRFKGYFYDLINKDDLNKLDLLEWGLEILQCPPCGIDKMTASQLHEHYHKTIYPALTALVKSAIEQRDGIIAKIQGNEIDKKLIERASKLQPEEKPSFEMLRECYHIGTLNLKGVKIEDAEIPMEPKITDADRLKYCAHVIYIGEQACIKCGKKV